MLARELDVDDPAAQVRHVVLCGELAGAHRVGAPSETHPRAGGHDRDIEAALPGAADLAAAAERARYPDDDLPDLPGVPLVAVADRAAAQRRGRQPGLQRADRVRERAEAPLCGRASRAAMTDSPAEAALTNGRPSDLGKVGGAGRRAGVARQLAGLLEVHRDRQRPGEVVGGADRDYGQRHARAARQAGGEADGTVAAGDDDPVRPAERRAVCVAVQFVDRRDRDAGAVGGEPPLELAAIGGCAGVRVGDEGQAHRRSLPSEAVI